jgi:hypothetical protein
MPARIPRGVVGGVAHGLGFENSELWAMQNQQRGSSSHAYSRRHVIGVQPNYPTGTRPFGSTHNLQF